MSFWFTTSHLFRPLFAEVLRQSALPEVLDVFHSLHFSTKWTEQLKQNDSQTVDVRLHSSNKKENKQQQLVNLKSSLKGHSILSSPACETKLGSKY